MSTPIVREDVAAYVAAVRVHLDDLSAEEVDELTGGLEADLDDALDEAVAAGRTPAEQFGPPATYAAELRAAARFGAGLQGRWDRLSDRVTGDPRWPAVRDFLVEIRPAWWVIRAVIATLVLREIFSAGAFLTLVLLVAAVVVSVEWGRRRLAGRGWPWRLGIRAGNVLAVLLIPVMWGGLGSSSVDYSSVYSVPPANGVWVDGVEVRNIFPYDDQGRPLSGVQLYDENGRPVQVGESARTPVDVNGTMIGQVPAVDRVGQQRWNVFPLRQHAQLYDDGGELRPDPAGPTAAVPPSVTPGPLLVGGASPAPTASPAPSSTVSPTPSSTVSPTPSPTASPTPSPTATVSPSPTLSPIPTASTR